MKFTEVGMSAITGSLHFDGSPVNFQEVKIMMDSLRKFPADIIHTWSGEEISMGFHGQWITPQSKGETLPYWDDGTNTAIVADAIIDNREELFEKLQVSQNQRERISDSKLILLAYYKWQEEAPKHLVGDFAFMIWDSREKKLFGARDFSGARTLYFFHDHKRFTFSTTIEPILKLPFINRSLNDQWLAEFLAIPTMVEAVDMSLTVYQEINQLPPCHSITVKNGRVLISKYSNVVSNQLIRFKKNEEYEEAFRDVFNKAVKARIRTFGGVGSHLSGGLDSGTVVSFAAKGLNEQKKRLHTYSYVPEDEFVDWTAYYYNPDERPYIQETVSHVGNINDYYFNFKGRNPYTEVDDFLELMEMPYKFFENSFWLKGIFEEAQKQEVKVLLNGARGNHSISWGSPNLTLNYYSRLLKSLKWKRLFNELNQYCMNFQTGKSAILPIVMRKTYTSFTSSTQKTQTGEQSSMLINPLFAEKTKVYQKLRDQGMYLSNGNIHAKNLNKYRNSHYELPYYWNKSGTATTKLSLRYGLWDRDPTNDLRVIRFCLSIPDEQYVLDGMDRSLIRRATANYLPEKVRRNFRTRGIQGADVIHRMAPCWNTFIDEIKAICKDSFFSELVNVELIKQALTKLEGTPRPEYVFSNEFRLLTRSLIVYRFIKSV
jgi:asparagine synthase (glutamine-hydrolysing)